MANVYMPASAALVSFILLVVYCTKEKIKIKENNIYLIMLICIMLDSLLILAIFLNAGESELLTKVLNRCEYMLLVTWSASLALYTHTVIHKKDEARLRWLIISRRLYVGLTVTACAVIWMLRLDADKENGIVTAITGPAVYFTFSCCAVNLVLSLLVILFNLNRASRKILPVFIFLGIAGLCAIVYYIDPTISGVSMGLAIVNLTMYFTIENPDVQMLEKVNMAKEQALRANKSKTDFLSNMSHEIRTPINAIVGLAECIENDTTLEAAKADAREIVVASDTLLEIINGILDISKIEAGRMEIVNKEYDLINVSEKLAKLIKTRIGEKPIELRLNFSSEIPGVLFGDETKLRQIMTNLLTNAVKYTDSGHIDFDIDCVNYEGMADLTISVSDTGRGIKADAIDSLFDKFKRLEEEKSTEIEGTGLGLAITRQLAEMLDGSIEVRSTYGVGSTFIFRVSQKIVSFERRTEEITVDDKRVYPGRRVLVVDDIAINLVVAKRILELYRLEVEIASSGEECLEKCKEQEYDLIFLDDMMPRMSGMETLRRLKEMPTFASPVIACTANAIEGMRDHYMSSGYAGYLSKPLGKNELRQILEQYLGS